MGLCAKPHFHFCLCTLEIPRGKQSTHWVSGISSGFNSVVRLLTKPSEPTFAPLEDRS